MPNYGDIKFELLNDYGEYNKPIKELLFIIIFGIAERSVSYYRKTKQLDHVFINSEGELHTTVTPSIAKIITTFKTEFPAKRKHSASGRRGHVDYWIFYKNIAFIVELKLVHKGFARGDCTTSERIFTRYIEALDQLDDIEEDKLLCFMEGTKKVVKIVFEVIVFGTRSKKIQQLFYNNPNVYHEKIEQSLDVLIKSGQHYRKTKLKLKKPIDFKALWFLHKDITFIKKGRLSEDHVFPAVGFIGHIEIGKGV
jgi:hypothetical protein